MSIILLLHRQNLIAQKNNYQMSVLRAFQQKRDLLNSDSVSDVFEREKAYDSELLGDSTQLSAINAELEALDNANISYFA